jgi:hypothetical protein
MAVAYCKKRMFGGRTMEKARRAVLIFGILACLLQARQGLANDLAKNTPSKAGNSNVIPTESISSNSKAVGNKCEGGQFFQAFFNKDLAPSRQVMQLKTPILFATYIASVRMVARQLNIKNDCSWVSEVISYLESAQRDTEPFVRLSDGYPFDKRTIRILKLRSDLQELMGKEALSKAETTAPRCANTSLDLIGAGDF